jgi:hypothetical protein
VTVSKIGFEKPNLELTIKEASKHLTNNRDRMRHTGKNGLMELDNWRKIKESTVWDKETGGSWLKTVFSARLIKSDMVRPNIGIPLMIQGSHPSDDNGPSQSRVP